MEESIQSKMARRAGFTLIEIIIAISIVGIMAAVAIPSVTRHINEAKLTAARDLVSVVNTAVATATSRMKKLPTTQEGWTELLAGGEDPLIDNGPDGLIDPWQNELHFEIVKKHKVLIRCAGPDGEYNTEDDILNFEPKTK